MTPDLDLQLRVVIKALKDVVLPAVDSANVSAQAQLRTSIATLEMVNARLPFMVQRAMTELNNAIELAEAVMAEAPDTATSDALAAAQALLRERSVDMTRLNDGRARLLAAVCDVVNGAADRATKRKIMHAVVEKSKSQFDLARAWCLPAGFESDPEKVTPLEDLLVLRRET